MRISDGDGEQADGGEGHRRACRSAVRPVSLRPQFAPHGGIDVAAVEADDRQGELDAAFAWLATLRRIGTPWRDMALVVPGKRAWRERVIAALDARGVPHRLLIGHPGARPDFEDDLLHAASIYTAIDFPRAVVAAVGLGELPWKKQSLEEALRVTRAMVDGTGRALHLSFSRRSRLTDALFMPITS